MCRQLQICTCNLYVIWEHKTFEICLQFLRHLKQHNAHLRPPMTLTKAVKLFPKNSILNSKPKNIFLNKKLIQLGLIVVTSSDIRTLNLDGLFFCKIYGHSFWHRLFLGDMQKQKGISLLLPQYIY